MWGTSYGYSDVTNSGFGVCLAVERDAIMLAHVHYVDVMQIKIYYTEPPPSGIKAMGDDMAGALGADVASGMGMMFLQSMMQRAAFIERFFMVAQQLAFIRRVQRNARRQYGRSNSAGMRTPKMS